MPENKKQGFIFGVIMSYAMAYGMEVYNTAIRAGKVFSSQGFTMMGNHVFVGAFFESLYMGVFVVILSELYGTRIGNHFMETHTRENDSPYFKQLMRQAGTVGIMCPSMSLVATILFFYILGGAPLVQFPSLYVGTLIKNFPMAFFWNMYGAAPFTRFLFGRIKRFLK